MSSAACCRVLLRRTRLRRFTTGYCFRPSRSRKRLTSTTSGIPKETQTQNALPRRVVAHMEGLGVLRVSPLRASPSRACRCPCRHSHRRRRVKFGARDVSSRAYQRRGASRWSSRWGVSSDVVSPSRARRRCARAAVAAAADRSSRHRRRRRRVAFGARDVSSRGHHHGVVERRCTSVSGVVAQRPFSASHRVKAPRRRPVVSRRFTRCDAEPQRQSALPSTLALTAWRVTGDRQSRWANFALSLRSLSQSVAARPRAASSPPLETSHSARCARSLGASGEEERACAARADGEAEGARRHSLARRAGCGVERRCHTARSGWGAWKRLRHSPSRHSPPSPPSSQRRRPVSRPSRASAQPRSPTHRARSPQRTLAPQTLEMRHGPVPLARGPREPRPALPPPPHPSLPRSPPHTHIRPMHQRAPLSLRNDHSKFGRAPVPG